MTKNENIDIVVLNQATPPLKHQVIGAGIVLKEAREERLLFETEVLREYRIWSVYGRYSVRIFDSSSGLVPILVKQELVAARLEKLREYLKTLKAIQKYDIERFKADVFVHATAERYLQLGSDGLPLCFGLSSHLPIEVVSPTPIDPFAWSDLDA
jgi:hypothetical protein